MNLNKITSESQLKAGDYLAKLKPQGWDPDPQWIIVRYYDEDKNFSYLDTGNWGAADIHYAVFDEFAELYELQGH